VLPRKGMLSKAFTLGTVMCELPILSVACCTWSPVAHSFEDCKLLRFVLSSASGFDLSTSTHNMVLFEYDRLAIVI
jgi:hypothetical protein